jgi:hypothetical protein
MSAHTSSTPTIPVPASAKAQPAAKASTPATTTSATPTTTYIPSGGTPPPSTTPTGAGTAARPATTTAPVKSTTSAHTLAHAHAKHSESLSTAANAIAVVAALLVLGCIGWALARRRAFEPHWMLSLRHSMAEAGFRASATWSEFADWSRLGR